ncbi:MAG TPA: recombinase family protein [Streptosporangiaceae bacterium]|jgi:DNA invertase Pin-like site-specific DNA recombinase
MNTTTGQDDTKAQLRAGVYARLSETYDAAESVPTQLANGTAHAERRGWRVAATFKDDGYSAFKEITRDDFVKLIDAIERGEIDVVIVRDVDRLTRNLADWDRFEKACVRHGVLLSPYTGGDLDVSTPEGAYYGGMETLRAKRESAVKSVRVREGKEREARKGNRAGGGYRWFGYNRVYANPDEPVARKRIILREAINPVEADAIRDAAERVLRGETTGSVIRDWVQRGIKPPAAGEWSVSSLVKILTSPRLAGLREWEGKMYPAANWPAIIDTDTHERLVKLFSDPARRKHVVGRKRHLLSGILVCDRCEHPLYIRAQKETARPFRYACVKTPGGGGCGGMSIDAGLLEEYVTGAVLDALESPKVQEAARAGDDEHASRRAELLAIIKQAQDTRDDARRDHADGLIDRADWLDLRERTEERIKASRREYDRLTGAAVVTGDIPPAELVRDAWESWNTDRKRAAIKSVLHKITIKPHPSGTASYGNTKDPAKRRALQLEVIRRRVDPDWRF